MDCLAIAIRGLINFTEISYGIDYRKAALVYYLAIGIFEGTMVHINLRFSVGNAHIFFINTRKFLYHLL